MKKAVFLLIGFLLATTLCFGTVSDTNSPVKTYTSGATLEYPITFEYLDEEDIEVILYDPDTDTETSQTIDVDYTISDDTVTYTTAPGADYYVILRRITPYTQETDFDTGSAPPLATYENAFDKLTYQTQDLDERVKRAFLLPSSSSVSEPTFPDPTYNAGKGIRFNAGGTAIEGYTLGSAVTVNLSKFDDYDDVATMVSEIGATEIHLICDTAVELSEDTTFPATMSIEILKGGSITLGDYDLTINGPFQGSPGCFVQAGTGSVTFGAGVVDAVMPEWWGAKGDGTTDDGAAIKNAMLSCYEVGIPIKLKALTYRATATTLGATPIFSAIIGTPGATLALEDEIQGKVYDGFYLRDLDITTSYEYANTTATFYYLLNAQERLNSPGFTNVSYVCNGTVEDGSKRGYGLITATYGVKDLVIENISFTNIRRCFVVGATDCTSDLPCIEGAYIDGWVSQNCQGGLYTGSPATGAVAYSSYAIVINNFIFINTAAQRDQYSGGARTGHSAIVGSLGIGAMLSNIRIENAVEHALYVYARNLQLNHITLMDSDTIKVVGYSSTALATDIKINDVVASLSASMHTATASIVTLYYVEGISISGIEYNGTDDYRYHACVSLSKYVKNLEIANVHGKYLLQGVISALTDDTWETAYDNITIRDCHILEPTSKSSSEYAALNYYLTYSPTGHETDAWVTNLNISNNYFGQAEGGTIERGRGTSHLAGLLYAHNMTGVTTRGNIVDGWQNAYSFIKTGDYISDINIHETMLTDTVRRFIDGTVSTLELSQGSRIEVIGRYASGEILSERLIATALAGSDTTAVDSLYDESMSTYEAVIRLADTDYVESFALGVKFKGMVYATTDSGEYLIAEWDGTTLTAISISAGFKTTNTAGNICIYASSGLTVINNSGSAEVIRLKLEMMNVT